jgi:hypothetical protein
MHAPSATLPSGVSQQRGAPQEQLGISNSATVPASTTPGFTQIPKRTVAGLGAQKTPAAPFRNHRKVTASQLSKTSPKHCPLKGTIINRAPTFLHNQDCGNGKNRGLYVCLGLGFTWLPAALMWKHHHRFTACPSRNFRNVRNLRHLATLKPCNLETSLRVPWSPLRLCCLRPPRASASCRNLRRLAENLALKAMQIGIIKVACRPMVVGVQEHTALQRCLLFRLRLLLDQGLFCSGGGPVACGLLRGGSCSRFARGLLHTLRLPGGHSVLPRDPL